MIRNIVLLFVYWLVVACQQPQKDLYREEVVGSLELLSSEKTGIDFSNTMIESKSFNHYFYSQIDVGSGVAIGVSNRLLEN